MGLLDEAIREHLELKRKHGASDEELHLKEQEALGPVRREPAEPPPPPAAEAPADALEQEPEDALEPEPADAFEPEPAEALGREPAEALEQGFDELPDDREALMDERPEEHFEEAAPEPAPESFQEPAAPFSEPAPAGEAGAPAGEAGTEVLGPEDDLEPPPTGDTPSRGFGPVEPPPDEPELAEDFDDEDDVLEETPEFLQESPEHDRLWFEQKPPRDFDFDDE